MDFETVLPFKSINDIVKEIKESGNEDQLIKLERPEDTPQCGCINCSCKD